MDEAADPIAHKVEQWVRAVGNGTTSQLQNQFLIGYNRASWLLLKLEERRVIERYTDEGDWSYRFRLAVQP
jgi:DNA segregation ATPase FtsK/SpoIIIE-like protein